MPDTQQDITDYTDLGWANGWTRLPEAFLPCQNQGHRLQDIPDPSQTGRNKTTYCPLCRIKFHTDSGD